jgi:hypothetical protein
VIRIAIIAVAALAQSSGTVGQTLTCSTWQGVRTCSGTNGYMSHEWKRDGMTIGEDNQDDRWTSWRWRDTTITTTTPPGR